MVPRRNCLSETTAASSRLQNRRQDFENIKKKRKNFIVLHLLLPTLPGGPLDSHLDSHGNASGIR